MEVESGRLIYTWLEKTRGISENLILERSVKFNYLLIVLILLG